MDFGVHGIMNSYNVKIGMAKVPVFRLFKIKAIGTGAFGDNPVYEAYGAYGAKRSSGEG
jgi:hypothetical protein